MRLIRRDLAKRALQQDNLLDGDPIGIFAFDLRNERLILAPRHGWTHGDLVTEFQRDREEFAFEDIITGIVEHGETGRIWQASSSVWSKVLRQYRGGFEDLIAMVMS